MSRQITDLSAAGANFFNALIELQRLHAKLERKFQRWFVDTRVELEQLQELLALERAKGEQALHAQGVAERLVHEKETGWSYFETKRVELGQELERREIEKKPRA